MNVNALVKKYPEVKTMQDLKPFFWRNPDYGKEAKLSIGIEDIFDAEARFHRFAPYFEVAFPETVATHGILESPLVDLPDMKARLNKTFAHKIEGGLYLKADNYLPISGSIKSRGGIYEVLKFAEKIAVREGGLIYEDNYAVLASKKYHDLFAKYGIAVGSTGNLGLSIGIVAQKLGFRTSVHMSADASQWKKDKLRAFGVNVVEYNDNFTHAITEARKMAAEDPMTYFIDDEGSYDLFLGYSVAALRLQAQLKSQGIKVDKNHPLFVYLPAGVGGSPSGVTFGLKKVLGEHVHAIFAEPTHIPSVTLGMVTGLNDKISVYDIGIDGTTKADGLAVGRASRIAGKNMRTLLLGTATFNDSDMMEDVVRLYETEKIGLEPSAAAGFTIMDQALGNLAADFSLKTANHIVWATGGSMVPQEDMDHYLEVGREELAK